MNRETLRAEIQTIAREVFKKPDLIVTDTLNAADVDTWTSLGFMQLLTSIEEKYGFRFRMMELLQLHNMGAVIDVTLTHVAQDA